jgi:hypothetical protein
LQHTSIALWAPAGLTPPNPAFLPRHSRTGYHWLGYPDDSSLMVAQWSPDSWSWIFGQVACWFMPEEIDGINYHSPCVAAGLLR